MASKHLLSLLIQLMLLLLPILASAAEPRVVRVGAFNYYPGIFQDTDGRVKGFYVEALEELGRRENIRFEYVYGSWSEGLQRISNGEVDLLTSVAYTPERALYMDYTKTPLLTVWGELYGPQNTGIAGIQDVSGKTVAVMAGDFNGRSFIELVKKFNIACTFVEYPGFNEVFTAVATARLMRESSTALSVPAGKMNTESGPPASFSTRSIFTSRWQKGRTATCWHCSSPILKRGGPIRIRSIISPGRNGPMTRL